MVVNIFLNLKNINIDFKNIFEKQLWLLIKCNSWCAAFFGMSRMIGLTKIDKGSKYGNSPAAKTPSPATDAGASPIKTD